MPAFKSKLQSRYGQNAQNSLMTGSTFSNAGASGQKSRQYQSSLSHSKVAQYWKRPTTAATSTQHDTSVASTSDLKSGTDGASSKTKFNNPYVYSRTNTSKDLHNTTVNHTRGNPILKDNFMRAENSSKLRNKARDNSEP